MFDKAGIYTIVNRKAKALISSYGEQVKLSPALGPKENLCQLWFVKPSEGGSFVITNLSTGKSLDLLGASPENWTLVVGRTSPEGGAAHQRWIIKPAPDAKYDKIQNVVTDTFMSQGPQNDENRVFGKKGDWVDDNDISHQWRFTKYSIRGAQVGKVLEANKKLEGKVTVEHPTRIYFVLDGAVLKNLWKKGELGDFHQRKALFEHDEFEIVYKATVAQWAYEKIQVDGFGILAGSAICTDEEGVKRTVLISLTGEALNTIIFFDPQTSEITKDVPENIISVIV
ncbi:hypothetical protein EV715DRAFT_266054 [Schizophyllum commune]